MISWLRNFVLSSLVEQCFHSMGITQRHWWYSADGSSGLEDKLMEESGRLGLARSLSLFTKFQGISMWSL